MTPRQSPGRVKAFKRLIGEYVTVYLKNAQVTGIESNVGYIVGVDTAFLYLGPDPDVPGYEILISIEDISIIQLGMNINEHPIYSLIDETKPGH